jgi:DNA polymerase III subunit beta
MKVICPQENLAKGLSIVGRAVSSRSTYPILANVHIAAEDGDRIKLSATNFEIFITCYVAANVPDMGALTVPAKTMSDLVGNLPNGEPVTLSIDTEKPYTMSIKARGSSANLRGIDAREFPLIPAPTGVPYAKINAQTLKTMIGRTVFSAATDETRPTLAGVHTKFGLNTISMAATDGFRLATSRGLLEEDVLGESMDVVIPAKALADLAKVITDQESSIMVYRFPEGNRVMFDLGVVVVTIQCIDGSYPDYSAVIPRNYRTRSVVNSAELYKACRTALIFAREGTNSALVQFVPGNEETPGCARVEASSSETGDNSTTVDAEIDGSEIQISFNIKYVLDVLGVVGTTHVAIETMDWNSPGVLKPVGSDDETYVIMPMHTK